MKARTTSAPSSFEKLPQDYALLCRKVWLPRPIRDATEYEAALVAMESFWGREDDMNADQTDWFQLVTSLVGDYEDAQKSKPKAKRLPLAKRLAGLIEIHGLTAADFGRLLDLEPSMGGKILKGTRQLTVSHIQKLAKYFGLPAEYFLEG
tara:strand:- start:31 stop:480 length:450 start_codon:yes stop_codon:yes gene_type:complete